MIEMEFEGKMFFVFKDYDFYLSKYYGDNMSLPPKEKQVPHLEMTRLRFGGQNLENRMKD